MSMWVLSYFLEYVKQDYKIAFEINFVSLYSAINTQYLNRNLGLMLVITYK